MRYKAVRFFCNSIALVFSLLFLSLPVSHAEDWVYTTRPGDSIWNISKRYLVDINDWRKLQEYNKVLTPKNLRPGTKIYIPYAWLSNQPKSARLIATQGAVSILDKAGKNIDVKANLALEKGYQIRTSKNSFAVIEFADGSRMSLQAETAVILNKITYFQKSAIVDTKLRLKHGNISSDVIPFQKPHSRFEIETPAAVAAVRGTTFHVQVPNENSMMSSVDGGTVSVSNSLGESILKTGFGTVTEEGKPPAPPMELLAKANLSQLPSSFLTKQVKFNWPTIDGAESYYSEIRKLDKTAAIVFATQSPRTVIKTSLTDVGKYQLSIRAIDQVGLQGLTAVHKFNAGFVYTDTLQKPKLNSPANGDETEITRPTFHWFNVKNAEHYRVQVALNSDFSDLIDDHIIVKQFYRFPSPLSSGEYFWRIAAISKDAEQGPYSDVYSLKIIN